MASFMQAVEQATQTLSANFQKGTGSGSSQRTWPVARDVVGLTTAIVNAYMIGPAGAGDREWVLVDAGVAMSAPCFLTAARERFAPNSRPAAIVLTHGHFDHVGALRTLADQWDAPIYCHEMELPYLTGQASYPPPDASVSGMMAFMSRLYPRGPYNFSPRIRALPADGSVPHLPDWQWIASPGHSTGHVSLFREEDRLLIAGDAFVTVAQESAMSVLLQNPMVHRPPAYFTPDWVSALKSVQRLKLLDPAIAATGHGPVVAGEELSTGLTNLIENWQVAAVPVGGRYSAMPALVGPDGKSTVPPPVPDYRVYALAAVGGLVLCNALFRGRRS